MKTFISTLAFIAIASAANAGNPPQTTCTNLENTIEISDGVVNVLVSKHPEDTYEQFYRNDLNMTEEVVTAMPEEKYGCTTRTVQFRKFSFAKKDGSPMPHAYNRLARKGKLDDYFICVRSHAWMPIEGETSCN